MALRKVLILRNPRSGRLEGRAMFIQPKVNRRSARRGVLPSGAPGRAAPRRRRRIPSAPG
jgi:hypothetical protein